MRRAGFALGAQVRVRQRLAVIFVQQRLGIERVDLRRPAVHEQVDDLLGLAGEMRAAWARARPRRPIAASRRAAAAPVGRQHAGQAQHAKAHAAAARAFRGGVSSGMRMLIDVAMLPRSIGFTCSRQQCIHCGIAFSRQTQTRWPTAMPCANSSHAAGRAAPALRNSLAHVDFFRRRIAAAKRVDTCRLDLARRVGFAGHVGPREQMSRPTRSPADCSSRTTPAAARSSRRAAGWWRRGWENRTCGTSPAGSAGRRSRRACAAWRPGRRCP